MDQLQHFIDQTFGTSSDTSATIIITLFVFLLGGIAAWLSGFIGREYARYRTRSVTTEQLHLLSALIEKQKSHYSKFVLEQLIEEKETPNFAMAFELFTPILVIRTIGYTKVIEAYTQGIVNFLWNRIQSKRAQIPATIIDAVESAEFWKEKSTRDLEVFIKGYNLSNETRNDSIYKAQEIFEGLFADIALKGPCPAELKPYFTSLDTIIYDAQNNPKFNEPHVLQVTLIEPILKLNRTDKNAMAIARHLSYPLLRADKAYKEMKNLIETYNQIFSGHAKSMEESLAKMKIVNS